MLFVLLFLASLGTPGLPARLKADEPAFYLMAASLWHDFDARCDERDLDRLFVDFPDRTENLFLTSEDDWETANFGVPWIYPALTAPAVGLFGPRGMLLLNALLLLAAITIARHWLLDQNSSPLATWFAASFFLVSACVAYVFWLQPEVLYLSCTTAVYGLVLRYRSSWSTTSSPVSVAISGAVAGIPLSSKPVLAVIFVPVIIALVRHASRRLLILWCSACMLVLLGTGIVAYLLTGSPSPYFSRSRHPVNVSSPLAFAERKFSQLPSDSASARAPGSREPSWWLKRLDPRRLGWRTLHRNLDYFLRGRHVGLLPYFPFALLCLTLFLLRPPKTLEPWLILACVVLQVLVMFTLLPDRWHGGGGAIGNRQFVAIYPALLFLVRRIRPAWLTLVGYALGGLFLGQIVFTPFGAAAGEWTLQAHTRNLPFRALPLELTLTRRIPGYSGIAQSGAWLLGRSDLIRTQADQLRLHGAATIELWLHTSEPLAEAVFLVTDLPERGAMQLCLGETCERAEHGHPEYAPPRRLSFPPDSAATHLPVPGDSLFVSRFVAKTGRGEKARWRGGSDLFLTGATVLYLGSESDLAKDVFAVEWLHANLYDPLPADRALPLKLTLRNVSKETWLASGPTRVTIGWRWLAPTREIAAQEPQRLALPRAVAAGEEVTLETSIPAPGTAGRHVLELDLVREHVAWFSERQPSARRRIDFVFDGVAATETPDH